MSIHHCRSAILPALVAAVSIAAASPAALASGEHAGGHGHGDARAAIGEPGAAANVSRTIEISMTDIAYEPESIRVEAGETVRFVVKNEGELVHEFNIGTTSMHRAHQDEMLKMMQSGALTPREVKTGGMSGGHSGDGHGMKHDDPNSVLLESGESAELVWKFEETGRLEFACNVPGHYEAGMVGQLSIE